MSPRTITLQEIAYRNLLAAGHGRMRAMKKAAEACVTIGCLAIAASRSDDGFPTQEAYATFWKQSYRSTQRDWQRFREAFPTEDGPERLARWIVSEYSQRLREREDASLAASLPADAILLATA